MEHTEAPGATIEPVESNDEDAAISEAERRIQTILIDLSNELELDIDDVMVDTRNFANLSVEILIRKLTQRPREAR